MTDQHKHSTARSTSLALIALTLLAGIALGWLLRDLAAGRLAPTSAPTLASSTAPSVVPSAGPSVVSSATIPATSTLAPSAILATPTATPAPTLAPSAVPTLVTSPTPAPTAAIAGYAGHQLADGETLDTLAAAGGSTPDLIARYNRLEGAPQPGRALIVPRLAGATSTLTSQPLLVQRGSTTRPWVALTLDAGASAEPVASMLETLRQRGVTLTFFLTGKWIKENPELTRQIVADGHEIANHTFNHPDMRNLSAEAIDAELAETEASLSATAPGASIRPFFRPPYGAYDERVLQLVEAHGYLPVYWTLDSLDSVGEPKTPEFLLERVTGKLPPDKLRGAIILAHCGSQPTADALPQILDRFAEMGFTVKKVSQVLGA